MGLPNRCETEMQELGLYQNKMEKKRFTEEERNFLLLLIEKHRNVVENKETDSATLQRKRKAWNEIQARFNSEPGHTKRTVFQLQKCWDNIKTKRRKKLNATKHAKLSVNGNQVQRPTENLVIPIDTDANSATSIKLEDNPDNDTFMMLSCVYEPYQSLETTNELFDPVESSVQPEEPASPRNEDASVNDLNVSSEDIFYSQKRTFPAEQQTTTDAEFEGHRNKISSSEAENQLHQIRKQEAEIRFQIALEELEQAKIHKETARKEQEITIATAQQKLDFERKLCEMTLLFKREKHKAEMDILLKKQK